MGARVFRDEFTAWVGGREAKPALYENKSRVHTVIDADRVVG